MTILIVDDEPEFLELLKDCFVQQGWSVLCSPNGEEALDMMEDNPVDLVVSDVYMPHLDGLKFHRKVRQHPKFSGTPFLFLSSYDDEYSLAAVKGSKIDGFVKKSKPVNDIIAWVKFLSTPPAQRKGDFPEDISKRITGQRPDDDGRRRRR
jgi:CheY-like chemotaxis protein